MDVFVYGSVMSCLSVVEDNECLPVYVVSSGGFGFYLGLETNRALVLKSMDTRYVRLLGFGGVSGSLVDAFAGLSCDSFT